MCKSKDDAAKLRRCAETRLRGSCGADALTPADTDLPRLVHELQVHQIELEMQNEELRRVQEELDAERTHYFDLYNLAPVGYCTLGEQGLILQTNLAFATLLGIERIALINQPLSRFIYRNDAAVYLEHRRKLITTCTASACELRMLKADGTAFWVSLTASAGPDADGRMVVRLVVNDISEHKQAEAALREHRRFSQMIAENIGDFIAVLDREGRRLYSSASYRIFFGGTKDLRGTDSFADVHPDDRERVRQLFMETVETGIGRQTDYRLVIADGSVRDMESRGSVVKDSEGRVLRVVVVSHDVTERKQAEAQVLQLAFHDTLTDLPNRRLLNDRLSQSMAACARNGCYGAVMFLDLDGFKPLNDTHGHATGDLLLIETAERLKSCVREMDTVARVGGDEFVVMISELNVDKDESMVQARIIAEKIGTCLSAPYRLTVKHDNEADLTIEQKCTASIGVALFADHEASQDEIVKRADAAMYQAKAAGPNSIRFHDLDT